MRSEGGSDWRTCWIIVTEQPQAPSQPTHNVPQIHIQYLLHLYRTHVHQRHISPPLVNTGAVNPQCDSAEQLKNKAEQTVCDVDEET